MNPSLLAAQRLKATAAVDAANEIPLFRDLDLDIGRGDLVEVRGPNGSGKSTLLRCLAGLLAPAAGRIERRASVAYIGHRPGLSGRLTAAENVRWLAGLRGLRVAPAAIDAALRRVGLGGGRFEPCATLSAGQQRRAALARLIVCPAELWLLDEPLTWLDDAGARLVRELLAEHLAADGGAVCATHRTIFPPGAESGLPDVRVVALDG